jgi:superfamily II DNA or RNA helicase
MTNPFQTRRPTIDGNPRVRTPQREVFHRLSDLAEQNQPTDRESGVILPVGCGKSGCIALAPFAFKANRALVVAPGLTIATQLARDFDPANPDMFYLKSGTLVGGPFPEPVEIRGTTTNLEDLREAHVVITNIQQLQGADNRWVEALPADFFDLILVDEGHHNVAASWESLKARFPSARVVNFSATPLRADGQLMAGTIVYSYPVYRAIQEGFVKRLKAVVLNPRTLRYVRNEDGVEVEVSLDEVRRLGENDADFRRSIVTSKETLNTIADASLRELQKARVSADDPRLKIIASALNYAHCRQIVEAYRERGMRADYVHSREDAAANARILQKLDRHELDVIVQVRKLGEGFDHRFLTVAAVFSVFNNLSPFVQFVGRIMRVIVQNDPGHPANRGVVVFHAGANVARRWQDFQNYSEADQRYFDELLPLEGLDFTDTSQLEFEPSPLPEPSAPSVEVRAQSGVQLEEIPLIKDSPEALEAVKLLIGKGYGVEDFANTLAELQPVPTTKARQRQARRQSLDARVQEESGKLLAQRGVNPGGTELDVRRIGRNNFAVVTSSIHRQINVAVGRADGQRHEFTKDDLDTVDREWEAIIASAIAELFDGRT